MLRYNKEVKLSFNMERASTKDCYANTGAFIDCPAAQFDTLFCYCVLGPYRYNKEGGGEENGREEKKRGRVADGWWRQRGMKGRAFICLSCLFGSSVSNEIGVAEGGVLRLSCLLGSLVLFKIGDSKGGCLP